MDRSLPAKGAQRWVPLTYMALAHLALGSACAVTLWDSSLIAGFFYHPKMIAVVHALTLGWISSSLIGMLYVAGSRLGFRATRLDVAILVAWAAGASGLVSHFWIETFGGMMWSAGLLGIAVLTFAARFGMAFAAASLPDVVKLQINLAWLNLVGTAFIGLLLGINKTSTVLPGYSLHNVFAHAHLAALGWAFLLSVALGHLFLVTHGGSMPTARWSMPGTILTQLGAAGIFVCLLIDKPYVLVFAIVVASGMTLCIAGLVVHARSARLPAASLPLVGALVWLLIAAVIGVRVVTGLGASGDPELTMAYGVAGLLAGLGQWTCGLGLLWFGRPDLRPGREWPAVAGWFVASPLLVAGLAGTYPVMIAAGAAILLLAIAWTARSIVLAAQHSTG